MKSVQIIALRQDRKRLLEHLQDSELIQIEKVEVCNKGFSKVDMSSQIQIFERNVILSENALKILDRISPEKKSILSAFSGRREIDPDEIGIIASDAGEIIDVCNRICELNKQIADSEAERIRIKTALAQLEPWKNLDIPLNTQSTKTTAVFIGSVQKEYNEVTLSQTLAEIAPKLDFEFEIEFAGDELTCFVLFVPIAQKNLAETALRDIGFSKPIETGNLTPLNESDKLIKQNHMLKEKIEKAEKEIISFADRRKEIKDTQDYFRIRADKYRVIGELQHSRNVFVISGYIPEEDCEKLERLCERVCSCYVAFENADEDKAPIKLKNNRFAAPAQSIVNMYSPPSHDDIDPTPLLAFFFYFFFGMMFSDAGYGLLMIIGTGLAIKIFKPDKEMHNTLKLFQYCGVSTFIWGLVFASFFGDAPAALYNYFTGASITMKQIFPWPTIDPQKDALMLMIISIAFGLVHILVGMGCKFYVCLKHKDYGGAFFDTGLWMLMLVGFAVLAAGMAFSQTLIYIGAGIAIACAIGLILTQGRNKKGFGKVIGGLASLYDITGYISDLLSYSRLLALGLTTGVMAQVFNMLSTMFGKSWFGIILLIIVFVIGHAINIGLNALGSYVHTMRLQYVEMFGKFYEGGGKEFKPFKLNSKYIKIKEDKSK